MHSKWNSFFTKLLFLVCSLFTIVIPPFVVASEDNCQSIGEANKLFREEQYFESLDIVKKCAAKALYLIWLNEKEIGLRVDPPSMADEKHPHRAFYEYVRKNKDSFAYDEAHGNFSTTEERLREITRVDPKSRFLAEIEYHLISTLDQRAWEDGDGRTISSILIKKYDDFCKTYPDSEYAGVAKKRIKELEAVQENDSVEQQKK